MNRIAADRALFQNSCGVFKIAILMGETHTPSGEFISHSHVSQSNIGFLNVFFGSFIFRK